MNRRNFFGLLCAPLATPFVSERKNHVRRYNIEGDWVGLKRVDDSLLKPYNLNEMRSEEQWRRRRAVFSGCKQGSVIFADNLRSVENLSIEQLSEKWGIPKQIIQL